MPTTVANRLDLAKEVWDSDVMAKQFYDENPWLASIEQKQRVVIGKRAQVPVHTMRAGGASVLSSAGGSIHASGAEVVDQAQYNMAYNYFPVGFQVGALNEITGGAQSVGDALEHTLTSGISNVRNHISRQFLTGHGRIAQAAVGGASTTVELADAASTDPGEVSGTHALQMGWIVPDDHLQFGTIADPDTLTADGIVSSVIESLTDPDVIIDDSITTTASHFARLASNGTAVPTVESAGLVTMFGTSGNSVGNIDGATVSQWNPAEVFTGNQLPDLALLLRLSRKVSKRTGRGNVKVLTSLEQLDNIYQFLQAQVRFTGDKELGAGASEKVRWRGLEIDAFPQVPDNFLFFYDEKVLEIVVGKYTKPVWLSDIQGSGMLRDPRSTLFEDTVMYALGLATRRRNSSAAATDLVVETV
jgi:hypothetical protein